MKVPHVILLCVCLQISLLAQYPDPVITSISPFAPTVGDTITFTFDFSRGNKGLMGFGGEVYAHVGLITSESADLTDWRCGPTWPDNDPKYKLNHLGGDRYSFTMCPATFFDCLKTPYSFTPLRIAFVCRNADGSLAGRGANGEDVFTFLFRDDPRLPQTHTITTLAGDNCEDALEVCTLNGYSGISDGSYTVDDVASGTCQNGSLPGHSPVSLHNNSWLKFIADSTTSVFEFFVNQCSTGEGIQAAVYATSDCDNFTQYGSCFSPAYNWQLYDVAYYQYVVPGLTKGNTYYLMIDGSSGDVCHYIIRASEGIVAKTAVVMETGDTDAYTASCSETFHLKAAGGAGYTWASSTPTESIEAIAGPVVSPTVSTTYTVTVHDFNSQCPDSILHVGISVSCTTPLSVTSERNICKGTSVTLTSTDSAGPWSWSSTAGGNYPSTRSITVIPATTSTYTVNASASSNTGNLITNGGFEAGNTGFQSNYNYQTGMLDYGQYGIGGNASTYKPDWFAAVTPYAGSLMYVADGTNAEVNIWSMRDIQNVHAFVAGERYDFSCWLANIHIDKTVPANDGLNPPQLQFYIEYEGGPGWPGEAMGNIFTVSTMVGQWNQFMADWSCPAAPPGWAHIHIMNKTSAFEGNDFAMDDLYFGLQQNSSSAAEFAVNVYEVTGSLADVTICNGDVSVLTSPYASSSQGPLTFSWNASSGALPAGENPSVSPAITTTYTLTVTDTLACTKTDTVVVRVNDCSQPSFVIDDFCVGLNSPAPEWEPTQPAGLYRFKVPLPVDGAAIDDVTGIITGGGVGGKVYTVEYVIGYSVIAEASVSVLDAPDAAAGNDIEICIGDTAILSATGGTQYVWDDGTTGSKRTVFPQTTQTYTVTAQNLKSCTDADEVIVAVNLRPAASIVGVNAICKGESTRLLAAGGSTFHWDDGSINASRDVAVSGIYTVIVADDPGCKDTASVEVIVHDLPALAATDTTVCSGDTVAVAVTGGVSGQRYQWHTGETQSTITVRAMQSDNYTVTVTTADGCSGTAAVAVTVVPYPVIDVATPDTAGCMPHPVIFTNRSTVGNGAKYAWNFGDHHTATNTSGEPAPSHLYQQAGVYSISVSATNPPGCKTDRTYADYITVYPQPLASFSFSPVLPTAFDPEVSFTDLSLFAGSWDWDFGDDASSQSISRLQHPAHRFSGPGHFPVTLHVVAAGYCEDDTTIVIHVAADFTLYIPNSFTPDGNEVNDEFRAQGLGISDENYHFYIYSRWGELLFEGLHIEEGWDGRKQGFSEACPMGQYVWQLFFQDANGGRHEAVGSVYLVR